MPTARDALRIGVHSGPQNTTYEQLSELWRRTEDLGYDWISVFDHFMSITGDETGPCFEGTTMLAALAAQTSRVRCGMLVSGVTYRHPAITANIAAAIDHVSGGRVEYGMGAAWFDVEHDQYGIRFPRVGERMDMLDEACRIVRGLWSQETFSFEGEHYQLEAARCAPKPVQERLPLVIGGHGEKRTLRIVAEHADIWNSFPSDEAQYGHLVGVLHAHCDAIGRPRDAIRKSVTLRAAVAASADGAEAKAQETLRRGPVDNLVHGTPAQVVERIAPYLELGARDVLLQAPTPYDYETLELFAEQVAPRLRARL